MASPKKMDTKKLEYYKNLLLKVKSQIIGDLRGITSENEGQEGGRGTGEHMADAASEMYEKEFSLSLASNEREVLMRIDAALKRIENGTYGICLESGKPIPQARLKALPYAEYTLEVQEEMDQKENFRK